MKLQTMLKLSLALLIASLSNGFSAEAQSDSEGIQPWQSDWGVPEGFSIKIDTQGYALPSAIAFVPNPGNRPEDPLYFVTELTGKIKVITNDRSVHVFAESFFEEDRENSATIDNDKDESGLTGICLAPEEGYIFATFAYDQGTNLINSIVRFKSTPQTFSLEYDEKKEIGQIFKEFPTDSSHQIGHCQTANDALYVSVGDGWKIYDPPLGLDTPLGKLLKFTFDGQPYTDNPYNKNNNADNPANYVWALGFRNPFGLASVNGEIFIAENGLGIDRFMRVTKGEDYLWDGTDRSIGAKADLSIFPAIGPTQIAYYPPDNPMFPENFRGSFYIGMTGKGNRGIIKVPYDFATLQVHQVPTDILRYLGPTDLGENPYEGIVTGVAVGPDGLYFASLLPNSAESATVFKIQHVPGSSHPFLTTDESGPLAIIARNGCTGCHQINPQHVGGEGPSLLRGLLIERLTEKLHSEAYLKQLDSVDQIEEEPFTNFDGARNAIRQASGFERIRLYVYYHILEPKFDNPLATMPNLDLSNKDALILTDYLVGTLDNVSAAEQDQDSSLLDNLISYQARVKNVLENLPLGQLFLVFTLFQITAFVLIKMFLRIINIIRN